MDASKFDEVKSCSIELLKSLAFATLKKLPLATLKRSVLTGWSVDPLISHIASCTQGRRNSNKVFMKGENKNICVYLYIV